MNSFKDFVLKERYVVRYKKLGDKTSFNEITVDDDQFVQAFRHLQVNQENVNAAVKRIRDAGLGDRSAQQILTIVMKFDEPIKFFDALNNPMTVTDFLNSGDIIETVSQRYNLDRNLIIELLDYQAPTQPATGKAEAFMCLFVKGAKKGKTGDIEVDGRVFEIKGSGARVQGSSAGFGSSTAARRRFISELQVLFKKVKIQAPNLEEARFDITPVYDGDINDFAPILTSTYKISKEDIVNVYASGLKEIYERADFASLKAWLRRSLNKDGTMNEIFKQEYFLYGVRYYAEREGFDYLVTIGTNPFPKALFGKMN